MRKFLLIVAFFILGFVVPANAQTLEGAFKDWTVYSIKEGGEKVCYIISRPVKSSGNYKRRSNPYFLVRHRGDGAAEVVVYSGYPYKKGSEVELTTNTKEKFMLFTSEQTPETAWAKTEGADRTIIDRMMKGSAIEAKANSRLGSHSIDRYSLMGFTRAYQKMQSLCR